jgi:hypothetical protein
MNISGFYIADPLNVAELGFFLLLAVLRRTSSFLRN